MSDCERCNGDGVIDTELEPVPCPHCRDVCQWCNSEYDDGEPLGDTGLAVCRGCIRQMASFKEDVTYQFVLSQDIDAVCEDVESLRADLSQSIERTFGRYGLAASSDEWVVRDAATDTDGEDQ